jgi:hypothetical protein
MAEHTKLPWRVEKGTGLVWGDCTLFEDGTPDRLGVPVTDGQLERPWAQGKGPTYNEMEANAAYIVRACNAFPDLVKAMEEIADMDPKGIRADDLGRAARIARDALAAMKGVNNG